MLRQIIREVLLTEEIFGKQAFIYHCSKSHPDEFFDFIHYDSYYSGMNRGSAGWGLFASLDKTWGENTKRGRSYGPYTYKCKINLYGMICFDTSSALQVYGLPLTPYEQSVLLKYDKDVQTYLQDYDGVSSIMSTLFGYKFYGKVKGIVDGPAVVIYDTLCVVPVSWKYNDNDWTPFDRNDKFTYTLRKSSADTFERDKYNLPLLQSIQSRMNNAPKDKRVFVGNLNLKNQKVDFLPDNMQVHGSCTLSNSKIQTLPSNFYVKGDLYLQKSDLFTLPNDLVVDGNLDIRNTLVSELPDGIRVGGKIIGFSGDKSKVPSYLLDKLQ